MVTQKISTDEINSKLNDTLRQEDEDDDDDDSLSVDLDDVMHDDLIGDLLIRILTSPLIDDPFWVKHAGNKNMEPPAYLNFHITYDEIVYLCTMAAKSFLEQPALIRLDRDDLPLHIVADLHGNLPQVLRIFKYCGIPQKDSFLFLGDYVDRGVQGLEVITLLFCLKIRYPYQVYLLRGNHEDANTTLNYGFFDECINRWPTNGRTARGGDKIWRHFLEAFNCMPVAAVIAGKIFCAHGGISPFVDKLSDINEIKRPSVVPAYGIGCDLLWSDPSPQKDGWVLSHRGISFLYGPKVVEEFCQKHKIDIILRGHQINNEMYKSGYRFYFNGRLVTLFSAPNYMNYKNNSCVITVTNKVSEAHKIWLHQAYLLFQLELKITVFQKGKKCSFREINSYLNEDALEKQKEKKNSVSTSTEEEGIDRGSPRPNADTKCSSLFYLQPRNLRTYKDPRRSSSHEKKSVRSFHSLRQPPYQNFHTLEPIPWKVRRRAKVESRGKYEARANIPEFATTTSSTSVFRSRGGTALEAQPL
ncbi:phosphoprotein phosphatase 1 domain protein [Oesophagostomum dentatum]|uniref:Serine/threonine-protein phosphatase n=1 Tax=Oesophagostomum dentatum TaxID=61180 RepID=A0A0B1TDT9_OESDE|nr:phosphoprotein phosphatase 1 domain protein [Oesophagostomum dentatum]